VRQPGELSADEHEHGGRDVAIVLLVVMLLALVAFVCLGAVLSPPRSRRRSAGGRGAHRRSPPPQRPAPPRRPATSHPRSVAHPRLGVPPPPAASPRVQPPVARSAVTPVVPPAPRRTAAVQADAARPAASSLSQVAATAGTSGSASGRSQVRVRWPAEPGLAGDAAWVPAGRMVSVGGYSLSGGLIYVGHQMPGAAGGKPDPALIDPSLPVDRRAPDYPGAHMGYWPSYSEIAPRSRAAYLSWLANGRHEPSAYIGYVFLYFYGLERRLLIDAGQSAAARHEREALVAEVRRLLSIYGTNHSFRGYAEGLLAVTAPADTRRRYLLPPPASRPDWALPFELQLGLGQLAVDERPLPVDWALAWLRLHPEVSLRTPATRCPAEFGEVFARRYRDRFGDGLLLRPGTAMLGGTYRPASAAIPASHRLPGSALPDVSGPGPSLEMLHELADETCNDLDGYSRYLGRHPDHHQGRDVHSRYSVRKSSPEWRLAAKRNVREGGRCSARAHSAERNRQAAPRRQRLHLSWPSVRPALGHLTPATRPCGRPAAPGCLPH
jgi:hypothetical protein